MKINKILILLSVSVVVMFSGCGTNTDNSDNTGYYRDSAVSGLACKSGSTESTTNASGAFIFVTGQETICKVGLVPLPTIAARTKSNPHYQLENSQASMLLLSLDNDADAENGIEITSAISALVKEKGWTSLPAASEIADLVDVATRADIDYEGKFVSQAQAQAHLNSEIPKTIALNEIERKKVFAEKKYARATSDKIRMAYYANWDYYKPLSPGYSSSAGMNAKYLFSSPEVQAKLKLINTIMYSFLEVSSTGSIQFTDTTSDLLPATNTWCQTNSATEEICFKDSTKSVPSWAHGNFVNFANSSVKNKMISIGGAGHEDAINTALNNPDAFVTSLKTLVKEFSTINGIDIDYEPATMSSTIGTKFATLFSKIKVAMGEGFLISYTFSVNQNNITAFSKAGWSAIAPYVDFYNMMGYDMFGPFSGINTTGLQSTLYALPSTGSKTFSDSAGITALKSMNVPMDQVILGIPAYGRAVADVSGNGLAQSFTNISYIGDMDDPKCIATYGAGNQCTGTITYEKILANYTPIDHKGTNGTIDGAYSNFNDSTYNNVFVSYDSPASTTAKVQYMLNENMAGVLVWGLNYDAQASNRNSILNTIVKAMGNTPTPTPTPTPVTSSYISINITADATDTSTVTFVNSNGGYYPFPKGLWGTIATHNKYSTIADSGNIDTWLPANGATSFTLKELVIYPNGSATGYACGTASPTFSLGNSYTITLDGTNQSCQITSTSFSEPQ
ncbi:MAG: hypothetical protein GQ570_04345 [Helicobacteraceae bacterium]|nr:hypothetical protein [Helicobacteraceae bacterium]